MILTFSHPALRAKQRKTLHTYLLPISTKRSKLLSEVCLILNDFQALFLPKGK